MDITGLLIQVALLVGVIVLWFAAAFYSFIVGWGLAALYPESGALGERILYAALLITLVALIIPASLIVGNIISACI